MSRANNFEVQVDMSRPTNGLTKNGPREERSISLGDESDLGIADEELADYYIPPVANFYEPVKEVRKGRKLEPPPLSAAQLILKKIKNNMIGVVVAGMCAPVLSTVDAMHDRTSVFRLEYCTQFSSLFLPSFPPSVVLSFSALLLFSTVPSFTVFFLSFLSAFLSCLLLFFL